MHPVSTSLRAKFKFTLGVVALCSLAACGGGGGGGAADGGNTPAQAPADTGQLTLTNANYFSAVQEVIASDTKLQSSGREATAAFGVDTTPMPSALQQVRAALPLANAWLQRTPSLATGVSTSETQACAVSGNMAITVDDKNVNNRFDAGDNLTAVMTECNAGQGAVNGTLSLTINTLTGDLDSTFYNVDVNAVFSNIKTVSSTESMLMDGTTRMVLESKGADITKTTVSTDSFKISGSAGTTRYSRVFSKFVSSHAYDSSVRPGVKTTITIDGELNSSNLNNRTVQAATVTPLVSTFGLAAGLLEVTGAPKGKARLTPDGILGIKVSLDADGDGNFETSTPGTWTTVRP
jgi:hypothetical protein